ncbi:hypothetical protein 2050HW_00043 [Serratia phage vB_SmaM_ 2050HW]|uniref:Uncharacterized protein n=2 Tax=Moabitevirus TaxID=2843422 RepID=A0A289ZTG8_9CAUD|nr:hypothetical protein HWB23_gp043 [Serratia phage vB_SmaM_ 2050HW]QPX76691.1 putative fatty acid binding protein [Serratia phage vB_SmaM_Yaphecito]UCR74664.1 hypothetical protein [Serratia phage BUCT660]UQT03526.1 hypothetical protein KODAMA_00590 [Serratia phage vB_SmaM-Kodama]URG14231.1 hypothetical protein [Pectobacterium phage vB_ParM-25]ATA65378.1 hypothetical protein 2050HW_00043 [Serratia phage vB_SmaM_ 2050HW]
MNTNYTTASNVLSFVQNLYADEARRYGIKVARHSDVELNQFFKVMDLNGLLKDALDSVVKYIQTYESVHNAGEKYKSILLPDAVGSAYRTMLLITRLTKEGYNVNFAVEDENGFSSLLKTK